MTYGRDRETMLYQYLKHIDPDLIIVDSIWFPLHPILSDFSTKKVFFSCYLPEFWFHMPGTPNMDPISFQADEYNLVFAMEPHFSFNGSESLPPMINNLEGHIQPPEIIRSVLGVPRDKKLALVAHNGHEGEIEKILKQSDLDPGEYCIRSLSSFDDVSNKLFPLSHYMSGVDLAIGGCGYHFFYETKFYNIPSIYIPQPRIGNEQHWRLENNGYYTGPFNGGELFAEKVLSVL